ncbi:prolyl hydroxylase family protein [Myxococcus faecalis]|uniref:prolyl hydroxylase family protein n=1 Tax=Myxococcus faecalis TaxID=3115646 RepID=UPI003CEFB6F6
MGALTPVEGAGGILEFPDALTDTKALLELAREPDGWQPTANASVTDKHANMRTLEMTLPALAPFRALVEGALLDAANARWRLSLREHLPQAHLVRYEPGQMYPPHFDHLGTPERFFTVIGYLNDDYQGGATVFPDLGLRIEPRAGKVAVFPSHYCHYPADVTAGTKYVAVTFLLGRRPGPRVFRMPTPRP